eukprot:1137362-Pelagomonas_calceolata.AAC.2
MQQAGTPKEGSIILPLTVTLDSQTSSADLQAFAPAMPQLLFFAQNFPMNSLRKATNMEANICSAISLQKEGGQKSSCINVDVPFAPEQLTGKNKRCGHRHPF